MKEQIIMEWAEAILMGGLIISGLLFISAAILVWWDFRNEKKEV